MDWFFTQLLLAPFVWKIRLVGNESAMRILIVEDEPLQRDGLVRTRGWPFRVLGIGTLLAAGMFEGMAFASALSYDEVFVETANLEGRAYGIGRDILEREGKENLTYLCEKATSSEWRECDLATVLLLAMEQPEQTARWRSALKFWNASVTPRNNKTVLVEFTPSVTKEAELLRVQPPVETKVLLDQRAIPVVLDFLREMLDANSSRGGDLFARARKVLNHLVTPEYAPAFVYLCVRVRGQDAETTEALTNIRAAAIPLLRDIVRSSAATIPTANDAVASDSGERAWKEMQMGIVAAQALGRLDDKQATQLLMEKIQQATDKNQIEAIAQVLGTLRVAEAVPVVFARLVKITRAPQSSNEPSYFSLREAMRAFGPAARDFLSQRAQPGQSGIERARAAGLLYELDHEAEAAAFYSAVGREVLNVRTPWVQPGEMEPDPAVVGRSAFWSVFWPECRGPAVPIPTPLLVERFAAYACAEDAKTLGSLKNDELSLEVMIEVLLRRRMFAPAIVLALAERGDDRVIETYSATLDYRDVNLIPALIEASLLLGSPKAIPLLEEILRRATAGEDECVKAQTLATSAIGVLRGDQERLAKLLEHDSESVREVAARVLARKGDVRGLPVLIQRALAERGARHAALRDTILGLRIKAVQPLTDRCQAATDSSERLLCEALLVRLTQPDLVACYNKAAQVPPPHATHILGPQLKDFQAAGKTFATAVGQSAVPLLEAAVAFDDGSVQVDTSIFALAELGKDRSIPIILNAAVEKIASAAVVGHALQQFGDRGIEAATKIPAPDPMKERYEGRASRHAGATVALWLAEDSQTVDNILTGLRAPRPDKEWDWSAWEERMRTYLFLAKKHHDQRLVEPVIEILEKPNADLWPDALYVLADYDDERIVPLYLKFISADKPDYARELSLRVLADRLGVKLIPTLTQSIAQSGNIAQRTGTLWALGRVVDPVYTQIGLAPAIPDADRKTACTALVDALVSDDVAVQAAAATAISGEFGRTNACSADPKVVKAFTQWANSQSNLSYAVVCYMTATGDPRAATALLAVYRSGGCQDGLIARNLGTLRCAEAIPDLTRAAYARVAKATMGFDIPELEALGDLGPAGLETVEKFFTGSFPLYVRVQAAAVLSKHKYPGIFQEVNDLFDDLVLKGRADSRLLELKYPDPTQQYRSYITSLAESLVSLNAEQAYPIMQMTVLRIPDDNLRQWLVWRLQRLEEAQPELRNMPVMTHAGPSKDSR